MVFYTVLSVILFLPFLYGMIFIILPEADQVVKTNRGIVHAIVFTRCCCLLIGLPLYMFTIWMIVVTTFDADAGYEVMELVCPEDYGCTKFFSFGLYKHEKDLCSAPFNECSEEDLYARAGINLVDHKHDLGIYDNEPTSRNVSYVTEYPFSTATSSASDELCECPSYNPLGFCEGWTECNDDVEDAVISTTCTSETGGVCFSWVIESDSAKKFWSASCSASETGNTTAFTCDEFTVRYFYPNVLLAVLLASLFLLPFTYVFMSQIKTQMKKIIKCNDPVVIKHSQAAGPGSVIHEYNIDSEGYYQKDEERKSKSRTCNKKDVMLFIVMVPLIIFTIWLMVRAAGRVGILLVVFVFLILLCYQVLLLILFKVDQCQRIKEMKASNGDEVYREYS